MKNDVITIVGRDAGAVATSMVEAILDIKAPETELVLETAMRENRYCPLVADKSKIKSLVLLSNGKVYPSTFRVPTLSKRLRGED